MASFGQSFAAARKAGKSTFKWNGKSYNTKLAGGSKPKAKKYDLPAKTNVKPKPRPSDEKVPLPQTRPNKEGAELARKMTPVAVGLRGAEKGSPALKKSPMPNPLNKYGDVAGGLSRPLQKGEVKEKKKNPNKTVFGNKPLIDRGKYKRF